MMNNTYCVYMHTSPSGKRYIGITGTSTDKRWRDGKGYNKQPYFYRAINKYGWDNMTHEILFSNLSREEACRLEMICIKLFRSNELEFGYNLSVGGDFSTLGIKKTPKQIQAQSEQRKEYYRNHPEMRENMSKISKERFKNNPELRKHMSDVVKRIMSDPDEVQRRVEKRITYYKEHPEAVEKANLKRKQYLNENPDIVQEMKDRLWKYASERMRKVYCYETNTLYQSIKEASDMTGVSKEVIGYMCRGITKVTTSGYRFCYEEDMNNIDFESILFKQPIKKIYCYETDMVYDSGASASQALFGTNKNKGGIVRACKHLQNTCKSYHFCFDEERVKNNGLLST